MNATMIAGVLLAFADHASWGALPSAFATMLTAWSKFEVVDKKLQRFSDAIESLSSLLRWWKLLGSVEKANLGKIAQLVGSCENAFQSERQGWVSTSLASQLLEQAADNAQGKTGDRRKNETKVTVQEITR